MKSKAQIPELTVVEFEAALRLYCRILEFTVAYRRGDICCGYAKSRANAGGDN